MWKKSFLMFLFSLSVQKAALDCERMRKTNEFPSPNLNSQTDAVMRGQNVSLSCFNQNKSLRITYFLFRGEKCLSIQNGPMTFNLTISEARDLGPYKCKAQVSNCSKYSREFNFTFVDPVTAPVLNISVVQTKTDRHIMLRCISFNGSLPINYTFFEKNMAISPVISKNVREPAEFNLTKNNTGEGKEYRCEAKNRLPDHAKYSQLITIPSTGSTRSDGVAFCHKGTKEKPGKWCRKGPCINRGESCPFCLQLLLLGFLLLVLIVIILILAFWMLPKYKARKAMKDNAPRVYGNTPMEDGIYTNICKNQAGTEYSQEIHYATPMFQEVAPRDQETCNDCKTGYVYSELIF
ncbi:allergin-1 isoform X1 [Neophocaena asiaeorientalis asiaeorientalis]|uniref:Allergin-1 isoform X1 n=1 Tax=Neophocaena asiaeorientalis asiaeorientalis TaxID=1706337 RepID=A0A341CP94_NEOAA|nr:allergin-1 isoform X1 [Neophocaena asiaeorientalis asiaeorientalis]XP_024616505.1 allergin-1 isoform X1 [Neophocaena asiaeorientalis asiaeorientalis]XP_032471925.1 allergin-1 isoform X2 [Phocoena sinus]XP_032471926.1 allergin-1 isoform X2 [Phocoena sinus]